jgi:RNA polymerase sigma-70 factor (ECF subfamily)
MSTFEKAKASQITASAETDWDSVYKELLPKVYHYFCLRVGDWLEAEDLSATTFERAWRDRERYRKDLGTFTNWLFGIAHHVTIAHFRKNKQEQVINEPVATEVNRPTEEVATSQQEFERLASMLTALPEREREIFSLKYGAQFTNRSIAKIVGVTESNVGTILHRIVSRLREQWEHENER